MVHDNDSVKTTNIAIVNANTQRQLFSYSSEDNRVCASLKFERAIINPVVLNETSNSLYYPDPGITQFQFIYWISNGFIFHFICIKLMKVINLFIRKLNDWFGRIIMRGWNEINNQNLAQNVCHNIVAIVCFSSSSERYTICAYFVAILNLKCWIPKMSRLIMFKK